jgi:hypothetical protein
MQGMAAICNRVMIDGLLWHGKLKGSTVSLSLSGSVDLTRAR